MTLCIDFVVPSGKNSTFLPLNIYLSPIIKDYTTPLLVLHQLRLIRFNVFFHDNRKKSYKTTVPV